MISKQNKRKVKKVNQASLLSVESSHNSNPNYGAAGHVMPETMFPHVKLERKTPLKKFVAANGEQIKDLGAKRIPFKTNKGIQRCITFGSANVVKPSFQRQRSSWRETLLCWMKRIRTSETFGMEQ